jgi:phosphatidylserine/phosphatidylglycerophosphate/cardiolipin synthase-like enzyme
MKVINEMRALELRIMRLRGLAIACCLAGGALCWSVSRLADSLSASLRDYSAWTVFFGALAMDVFIFGWTFLRRMEKAEGDLEDARKAWAHVVLSNCRTHVFLACDHPGGTPASPARRLLRGAVLPLAAIFLALMSPAPSFAETLPPLPSPSEAYFSPRGGAREAVVREIGTARREVLVAAYAFTSEEIAAALVGAARRGVAVSVVLDRGENLGRFADRSQAGRARAGGCRVLVAGGEGLQHDKFIVVDGAVLITGSYNFTEAAETRNRENLLVIRSPEWAQAYRYAWRQMAEAAEGFQPH